MTKKLFFPVLVFVIASILGACTPSKQAQATQHAATVVPTQPAVANPPPASLSPTPSPQPTGAPAGLAPTDQAVAALQRITSLEFEMTLTSLPGGFVEAGADLVTGEAYIISRDQNLSSFEFISDGTTICARGGDGPWECDVDHELLIADLQALPERMTQIVTGQPVLEGETVTGHEYQEGTLKGEACHLFYLDTVFERSSGQQVKYNRQVCFDPVTYSPVWLIETSVTLVGDEFVTETVERRFVAFNQSLSVTLPQAEWKIIPVVAFTSDYYYPFANQMLQGPARPGWKYLNIPIAVENVSNKFLTLTTDKLGDGSGGAFVVTAQGYTYPRETGTVGTGPATYLPIPPGFRVFGFATGDKWGLVFRVAENASGFELHFPGFPALALDEVPSGMAEPHFRLLFGRADSEDFTVHPEYYAWVQSVVDETSSFNPTTVFPTSLPDSAFLDLGDLLPLDAESDLTVLATRRGFNHLGDGHLEADIQYRNHSGGYDKSYNFHVYIIGEDGIGRASASYLFPLTIGPGQTEVLTYEFIFDSRLQNLKLVIADENVQGIFNVP